MFESHCRKDLSKCSNIASKPKTTMIFTSLYFHPPALCASLVLSLWSFCYKTTGFSVIFTFGWHRSKAVCENHQNSTRIFRKSGLGHAFRTLQVGIKVRSFFDYRTVFISKSVIGDQHGYVRATNQNYASHHWWEHDSHEFRHRCFIDWNACENANKWSPH